MAAAVFLFHAVREIFSSPWPAWTAMLVFLLNPNGLYLQSTAMSEPYFAAALTGILYFTVRFPRTQCPLDVSGAALCALAGTLIRYEGWFLLPFCAAYFFLTAHRRLYAFALFCGITALGPLSWLAYNWWLSGNPIDFFNGSSSAQAIQGGAPYAGFHDWYLARLYYRTCVRLVLGPALFVILAAGLCAALLRRKWWPVLLLSLPPAFYVWSVHSSYLPIHMPELWPHSWYNTRYGLAALPLAAFAAGSVTRTRFSFALVALAVAPWLVHPSPTRWITWEESLHNSQSRRAWTSAASQYLAAHYRPGEHIAAEFNDTIGIFRYAGIPLRNVFHPGNTLLWQAAIQRPDLFLNTRWVVCQRGGALSHAVTSAPAYTLVHTVEVPFAPPVDIYLHDYPLHQSPRRAERLSAHLGL